MRTKIYPKSCDKKGKIWGFRMGPPPAYAGVLVEDGDDDAKEIIDKEKAGKGRGVKRVPPSTMAQDVSHHACCLHATINGLIVL